MIKDIVVLGGGVVGWFTAAFIRKNNPDINVTLIESNKVPILGVGESTIPQLGDLLKALDIDEKEWMKGVHGIHKLGNHFVGWNSEEPKPTVKDHWNAPIEEHQFYHFTPTSRDNTLKSSHTKFKTLNDYLYDNDGLYGVDNKDFNYFIELCRRGVYNVQDASPVASEQYYFAINNKSIYDNENHLMLNDWKSYAWHVDAERFPVIVRELSALPNGVEWVTGHVMNIYQRDNGDIDRLILEDGRVYNADLYLDCTGFNRVLMSKLDNEWETIEQLPTQSAWVAPVKYNDPVSEMRPYTQSYAQPNGWNFIITLYSRMGSGYIFDANCEDKDEARERFIKYWDGYELLREPRFLSWEQGWYKDAWKNNVVGMGMAQGFVDPMEANSIYVAQSCIEMTNQVLQKYKHTEVPEKAKKAFSRHIQKLEKQIRDFISYHFTISERQDSPMFKKWVKYGQDNGHIDNNWKQYLSPRNYTARNIFLDYQWAAQQMYLNRYDRDKHTVPYKEELLDIAYTQFEFNRKKNSMVANLAPNVYDWSKDMIYNGATHEEVLEDAIKERNENIRKRQAA